MWGENDGARGMAQSFGLRFADDDIVADGDTFERERAQAHTFHFFERVKIFLQSAIEQIQF